jgi:uncharacterized membrane protein SirB2
MLKSVIALLEVFSDWAAKSPLNSLVVNAAFVVPAVQVVHILCVSVVLAAIVMVNLRIFGLAERSERLKAVAERFLPALPPTLLVLLLTGFVLIVGEPTRAIYRTVFWAKMAMILIAGALAADVRRRAGADPVAAGPILKAEALTSLCLWFAVVAAGRWIGYASGWAGAPT